MSVTTILFDFCFISVLLFIGKVIRTKVRFIQKLYIPSALFVGLSELFCGKYFLNIIPFSNEISNYSGVLIVVLFVTMFLGSKPKSSFKSIYDMKKIGTENILGVLNVGFE